MAVGLRSGRTSVSGGGISYSRLLIDTTTLTTGDIIRVRSQLSPASVWNTEVETPGDYIVFDIPGMDRYKISLVREVEQVETEVESIYKTIGSGEAYLVDVLNKTTLTGIQNILNSHSELSMLSVGDEVTVNIGGSDEIFIIAGINVYGSHEVIFISKYTSSNAIGVDGDYAELVTLNNYLDNMYSIMNETDKSLLKERRVQYVNSTDKYVNQKIWIPSRKEVFGDHSAESESIYLPYFTSSSNRIRTNKQGTATTWTLRSRQTVSVGYTDAVNTSGNLSYANSGVSILTSFHLTADD